MAAPRLTDSQNQEQVARYRQGEPAQALAEAYGCSPNTVSRVVKAALSPDELAASRKQGRSIK
ncbi:MAG: helix-turn-helix domain-containing protein, partial [Vulcanococcus sp.]